MTVTTPSDNEQFDVVVIGAGINGAGIAREAALRGLRVLLLDKGDISSGASSFSTRLIHGGLRYLEHGEFSLVRESLRERESLLRIAPHLVKPLPMLIPIYQNRRRGRLTIRAGMVAYDLLSYDKSLPRHRMLSRAEIQKELPGLNPSGLVGGAVYMDAQVEFAERLVLENVLSARDHGAAIRTYEKVVAFRIDEGRVSGVEFVNQLNGKKSCVRAGLIVNAAGPWVDQVLGKVGSAANRLIGGTKGSHIIVAPFPGAPRSAIYVEAETDGRPFFVIPWNGHLLVGTTDKRFNDDLDNVRIDESETSYLLHEVNRLFPEAGLNHDSILFSYSGVRPLPITANQRERSITRRHFIREHEDVKGVLSIVGGKLTTYRRVAEQTVDLLFRKLGKQDPGSRSTVEPLPGAELSLEKVEGEMSLLSSHVKERLLRIYGGRTAAILELVRLDPMLLQIIDQESGAIAGEVVFAFESELAQTLSDCLLRRMMVGWNSKCGLNAIEAAVEVARKHLAWSEQRLREEVSIYQKSIERFRPQC